MSTLLKKYRPYWTASQVTQLYTLLHAIHEKATLSTDLQHMLIELELLNFKIKRGMVQPAYIAEPQMSLEQKLGMDASDDSDPELPVFTTEEEELDYWEKRTLQASS